MPDVHSPATRSFNMSRIRGKNTKPEVLLRSLLHRAGLRFRLHVADMPGKPDIVLPRYKAAVFVNGCYWHRHQGCRYCTTPATNADFWNKKFEGNVSRDANKQKQLQEAGWRVFVIWECELRHDAEKTAAQLADAIRQGKNHA